MTRIWPRVAGLGILGLAWSVVPSAHAVSSGPNVLLVAPSPPAGGFTSIQAAVNAANPGDWILIAPGVYHEKGYSPTDGSEPAEVLINKPNLHLRGLNRDTVIVDGTDYSASQAAGTLPAGSPACSSDASLQDPGVVDANHNNHVREGILVFKTSGVSIENLTSCNSLDNEIWWNNGDGGGVEAPLALHGDYITATSTYYKNANSRSAEYGIFTSDVEGPALIDHSYANNMTDSSYYVGACRDCNTVLNHPHAENSALGLSSTNAGGNLIVENGEWDLNRTGLVSNAQNNDDWPSPQYGQCVSPSTPPPGAGPNSCYVIRNNKIHDNNNPNTPGSGLTSVSAVGAGVELAATQHISVISNQIYNQGSWGVVTHDFPDPENGPAGCEGGVWESNSGVCTWFSRGNYVANNSFSNNGGFGNPTNGDIANQATGGSDASACPRNQTSPCTPAANPDPNCFANNTLTSSSSEWPAGLQESPCPPGASETPVLTQQLLCATGATSLFTQGSGLTPPPCDVPGSNYPQHNATASTCTAPAVPTPANAQPDVAVCFLPLSYTLSAAVSPTMPDQCAGVPPNAFCVPRWRQQSTPNPTGARASSLSGIACPSATLCTAVGSYTNSSGVAVTLAERWNGTSWAVQTTPNPTGARAASLNDVACPSTSVCTAVGSYTNSSGVSVSLAERWNGTSWAIQSTPNPSVATFTVLRGVSCPSTSACMAVGWYRNGSGLLVTLAERWSGGIWGILATPSPTSTPGSGLHRVSCLSATACVAVGDSNNAGALVTLAESWNGSTWAIQATPNPSGAKSTSLQGVSCKTSSAALPAGYVCTASWVYTNSSGVVLPLAERFNGSTWSIQATPTPSGAKSSSLPGVGCFSTSLCTAVGFSTNSSGVTTTLAEGWIAGTWVIQPTANPGAQTNVLSAVACPSTALCSAVGYYKNSAGVTVTLAERYS